MSNLGWYQKGTWLAKRVGGPINLALLIGAAGYLTGKAVEIPVKSGIKAIKEKKEMTQREKKKTLESKQYKVKKEATDDQGLFFRIGDRFNVLESDGDSILIEKIGDKDNPYFVSREFLSSISDFK